MTKPDTNTPYAPNLTPAERRKRNRLAELLDKAKDHVMTPEEIAAQRKSWVCGEMLLQYPTMTYDEASDRYDAITASPAPAPQVTGATYSQAEYDEAYEIGKRDGYSEAVQQIDQLTGGDGEYRYCLGDEGSARHMPGPSEMIQRIIDRFETLNLLDEATKSGRDQEWGDTAPAPRVKPDYWAIHSATGIHIGLWPDKADADEALREYEGGTITPLYTVPPAPAQRAIGSEANHDLSQNHLIRRCVEIADQVVPSFRGKGLCCTGPTAKRWQAAYDGAARALGLDDEEQA